MGWELYNRVYVNGKRVKLANVVWNKNHPDDPLQPDEIIHHKDGNKKNDDPSNHVKMKKRDHKSLHSHVGTEALRKWRKENPEKALAESRKSQRKMMEILKADPEREKAWKENQRRGIIKANKARKGEKRSRKEVVLANG